MKADPVVPTERGARRDRTSYARTEHLDEELQIDNNLALPKSGIWTRNAPALVVMNMEGREWRRLHGGTS